VNDEEKCPVLRQSDDSVAPFAIRGGIFNPKERIEEHLAGLFKRDAVLLEVC
jgi:hypothetical protein